jgi:hypothetical protein
MARYVDACKCPKRSVDVRFDVCLFGTRIQRNSTQPPALRAGAERTVHCLNCMEVL